MLAERGKIGVVGSIGVGQTFGWGTTFYLPAVLSDQMGAELGISVITIYTIFSAAIIVSALLGPWAGKTIDTRGGRVVLCGSSLLFSVGLFMLGLSNDLTSFVIAWGLIGAGMSMGLYDAAFATLAGIYGDKSRGAITGVTLMAGLASSIFWPLTAYIDGEFGWRTACFIWAGCHLMIGLPLYYFAVPRFQTYGGTVSHKMVGEGDKPAISEPSTALMIVMSITFAALFVTFSGMATHLPRLLQEVGASKAVAISAAAMMGPAQIFGRVLDFMFINRFHPVISARVAVLCHPIGAVVLMVLGAPAAMLFAVLHGMGSGILTIATGTIPLAIFGAAGYGLRQGLLMAPGRIGMAVAPFLFAVLIEWYGARTVLITSGLSVIGLLGLLYIPLGRVSEAR